MIYAWLFPNLRAYLTENSLSPYCTDPRVCHIPLPATSLVLSVSLIADRSNRNGFNHKGRKAYQDPSSVSQFLLSARQLRDYCESYLQSNHTR
jgi:hypothetical protein